MVFAHKFLNRRVNPYNFSPEKIQDLSGKVIIVTGGNSGLGLWSIIHLIKHNPQRIYLTARSQAKYDDAIAKIREHHVTDRLSFVQMDLTSLPSVRAAAESIRSSTDRVDILINSAGIMGAPPALTPDGFEIHFGTNHMGPALFTKLLMPLLQATKDARVVNVSSGAYEMGLSQGFDPDLVQTDMATSSAMGFGNLMPRYGQSKLANVLHAKGLAKRYPDVLSVSIAPGRCESDLLNGTMADTNQKGYARFQKFYDWAIGAFPTDEGAWTQVWAATEEKSRLVNGAMYLPVGVKDRPISFTKDDKMADTLWDFTEDQLKKLGY